MLWYAKALMKSCSSIKKP